MLVSTILENIPEQQPEPEKVQELPVPDYFKFKKTPIVKLKLPGRNDKCPCGSGKKYKNCCMKLDQEILDKFDNNNKF